MGSSISGTPVGASAAARGVSTAGGLPECPHDQPREIAIFLDAILERGMPPTAQKSPTTVHGRKTASLKRGPSDIFLVYSTFLRRANFPKNPGRRARPRRGPEAKADRFATSHECQWTRPRAWQLNTRLMIFAPDPWLGCGRVSGRLAGQVVGLTSEHGVSGSATESP